jgi:hypothetical protein
MHGWHAPPVQTFPGQSASRVQLTQTPPEQTWPAGQSLIVLHGWQAPPVQTLPGQSELAAQDGPSGAFCLYTKYAIIATAIVRNANIFIIAVVCRSPKKVVVLNFIIKTLYFLMPTRTHPLAHLKTLTGRSNINKTG